MTQQMGPVGQLVGAVISATGTLAKGAGESSAYQYNSAVEKQQAETALQQSYIKAQQTENQVARTTGQATAQLGASGTVANAGSALWVMNDIAKQGEMAKQLQLYQGRVEQHAHAVQSAIDHAQATAARTGSYFQAAGTLLGQAGDVATKEFTPSSGGGAPSDLMAMYANG